MADQQQPAVRYHERAQRVHGILQRLWGDEPPPGTDAHLLALVDAVAADDEAGASSGMVVQGDGLRLEQVHLLLSSSGGVDQRLAMLPARLQARLRHGWERDGGRGTDPGGLTPQA